MSACRPVYRGEVEGVLALVGSAPLSLCVLEHAFMLIKKQQGSTIFKEAMSSF